MAGGPPPENICGRGTRPPARSRLSPLPSPPRRLCNNFGCHAAPQRPHGGDGTFPSIHRPATRRHARGQIGGHEASETLTIRCSDEHVPSHPTRHAMTHWDGIRSRVANRLLSQSAAMDKIIWSPLECRGRSSSLKKWRSVPSFLQTDSDHPNPCCPLNRYMLIYRWFDFTNENAERIWARAGPAPFHFPNGAGPTPAPFRCFGADSYLQHSIMTIKDQNGVDRVDKIALRPHLLSKETRFYDVAQCVTNMRWGRRCWDFRDGFHVSQGKRAAAARK